MVQKNKVRGCDSATFNKINVSAQICEKLQLPTTDLNVAVIRELRSRADCRKVAGWVLHERKAYRQVPIDPSHRKFSVIVFRHYVTGKLKFFVMVGHSFGLVAAVYNYNRRSAMVDEIMVKLFGMVSFNYYDDKYGFEFEETASSAKKVAEFVHTILGAQFEEKKLQLGQHLEILGVAYDLELYFLLIKEKRKEELSDEIRDIIRKDHLDPGQAGKLKGKLMFAASQLWGKVGRAFMLAISERQYMKWRGLPGDDALHLTPLSSSGLV